MSRTLRCFVAVDLHVPRKARRIVERLEPFGPAVRPVAVENLHVTVQFLGDIEMSDVPAVDRAVKASCEGVRKFDVRLQGVGAFPNVDRPSVLWIGVHEAEPLEALAERLGEGTTPLGFPPEARRYVPHLTVGRVKAKPDPGVLRMLRDEATTDFGTTEVTRAVLYQSDLTRSGPIYAPLATYQFRKR